MSALTSVVSPRAGRAARVSLGPAAAATVILMLHWGVFGASTTLTVALAATYGIAVLGTSLLAGWGGIWSIGQPAFLAIGAYAASFGGAQGWPLETVLLVAVGLSASCGMVLGTAGARFSLLYVALLTLAFDLVVLELAREWSSVTGGAGGVALGAVDSVVLERSLTATNGGPEFAIACLGLLTAFAVVMRPTAARLRLTAAKSHAQAARSIGISPTLQSGGAFAVSAAVTSVGGIALGIVIGFVSPDQFSLGLAISLIAATVLGGTGSIGGAVVGGVFLAWSPIIAQDVHIAQPYLVGGVLVAVLLLLPRGIVPSAGAYMRRATATLQSRTGYESRWTSSRTAVPADGDPSSDSRSSSVGGPGVRPTSDNPVILNVEEVSVRYGELAALSDLSVGVRRGEVLGIVGPNGAGKTTLINLVTGLSSGARAEGAVEFEDRSLPLLSRPTLRHRLGLSRTFQHAELFGELSVRENLLCTRRRAGRRHRRRVDDLLRELGLLEVADRVPAELSFGLEKRVDLGRALVSDPHVILLDEPFAGLDDNERHVAARQIQEIHESGATFVIIDHVLDELLAITDRLLALDFGNAIAIGAPSEVLDDNRVRESYLGNVTTRGGARAQDHVEPKTREPLILLENVDHDYGGVSALRNVDLTIPSGYVFGVAGQNGAGKSTLGRILAAAMEPSRGRRSIAKAEGQRVALVPEGREILTTLSVRENLEVAAYGAGLRGAAMRSRLDDMTQWLPVQMRDRLEISAAALSGGEQQMLAIARGLVGSPAALVLDEPALGLAPTLADEVYGRIRELANSGITVVLLEQLLHRALSECDEVAVLRDGRIVTAGLTQHRDFAAQAESAYFGSSLTPEDVENIEPSVRE